MSRQFVALELEFPSDVGQVERVVRLATDLCRELKFPHRVSDLELPVALSEAVSNAILRGNKEDPLKTVRVRGIVSDSALIFEVYDQGEGFDLHECIADPTSPDRITLEGGRGLYLMDQFLDKIEQEITDTGHVVRLILNR